MDGNGKPPDPYKIQQACHASGGRMVANLEGAGLGPSAPTSAGGAPAPAGAAAGGSGVSPVTAAAAAVAAAAAKQGGNNPGPAYFYAFLQRNWEGSPSSLNSM